MTELTRKENILKVLKYLTLINFVHWFNSNLMDINKSKIKDIFRGVADLLSVSVLIKDPTFVKSIKKILNRVVNRNDSDKY